MLKKILIVDDNAMNRMLLRNTLQGEYEILEASDGREALERIFGAEELSAVLLDIVMPEIDGYEVLRRVRDSAERVGLPVIMVTGSEDEESRAKALSFGANDFIIKPYNPDIVRHCVKNNIVLYETAAKLNAIQRDKLTGLLNREAFFEKAAELIAAQEPGYYMLSSFDIDNFTLINDQLGMTVGDRLLREIGKIVREDMAALGGVGSRITGDNFAVLFPAAHRDVSIGRILGEDRLALPGSQTLVFSIGRCEVTDRALPVSSIYNRAYLAKQSVKGRYDRHVAYFDESMLEQLVRNQQIIADVDAALAERQFEVWFQPQRNHVTGALIGAEALVRWRHPEKGLIPPGMFIPLFEQNGFIYELDKYVWEEACACLRRWIDEGRKPLPVSVNVSRHDVFQPDFVGTLSGLIERYALPVELLRIEITESAFVQSTGLIVEVVRQLVDLGFVVEIDDFGSGYSALNTLKSVPAQVVKLDMRFLEDDNDAERGGNILGFIVRMVKWLGMSVIAEGVEEKAQADYLASIGCSYIQGYYYARPMPAADYEAYCRELEREPKLASINAVENLDNNAFWDPKSIDTLIFSSYVGGACIFEYHAGRIELLRANRKFAAIFGDGTLSVEDTLRLDWISCLEPESRARVRRVLRRSFKTREEYTEEYVFLNIPGAAPRTYLRATMRVIATTGEMMLVYCTCENITAQRVAEESLLDTDRQLRFLSAMSHELLTRTDTELGVNAALRGLMAYFQGSRAYIFEFDAAGMRMSNTYEVCGEGVRAEIAALQELPLSLIAPWLADFERDGYCVIGEAAALGDDRAEERARLLAQGIRSLFAIPLRRDGALIGLMGIDDPQRPPEHVERLIALGDYLAVALTRRDQDRRISNDNKVLTTMMDDMPGGFVRMRLAADGTPAPFYFNEGFSKLTGMDREELRARFMDNILCGIHPEDHAVVRDAIRQMQATGRARSARYRICHRTDGYIWVTTFGRVTEEPDGGAILNAYFLDATDQVRDEELQKSLMDNMPCGAGIYEFADGQMRLIYQNRIYWELVGLNEEAYPDPGEMSAIHPDDVPVIVRELSDAIEQRRDVDCDIRLRHLTRGYRPVHLLGRIVFRETGDMLIYATFAPNERDRVAYQQVIPLLLSAMMGSSTEMFFAKDCNLRYLCASRAFADMLGLKSADEITGKTDAELFDAVFAEKFRRDDEALLSGGASYTDMVEEIPSRNGVPRYASTSKYVLYDGAGTQIGIFGVGRDMTDARATASQLALLTDNLPVGIAVFAGTADVVTLHGFSDGLCRLLGVSRAEYERLTAEEPFAAVCDGARAEVRAQVSALLAGGAPVDGVWQARAGGPCKWLNIKAVAGETGGVRTANAVFFDVTEQREALEKLRVSEEVNRLAIRHSMGVVCRYDVASRRLTVPESMDTIFETGATEEDVPEKPVREGRVSPDTADAYAAFYDSILRGEKRGVARFQRRSTQGWRWIEAHFTTIFADSGEPVTAVISAFDVTESLEKDAAYRKWKQTIRDKKPESYSLYRCNITKSTVYDAPEGLLVPAEEVSPLRDLARRTASYTDACVAAGDQQRFQAFLNRDAMLLRYSQGRRTDSIEYREKLPDGTERWLRLSVDFVDSPYSSEVEAFLLFEDIDAAKRAELEILDRAEKDQLTGVLNRGNFIARVKRRLAERKQGAPAALMIIDLDGFKQVNDLFGHAVGDETLAEIGQKLRAAFRDGDLVCRLGGDEFMAYLDGFDRPGTVTERAALLCASMHKSFSREVQLSASVGVAICPENGEDFETLYRRADAALYHVKGVGKDGFALYSEEMTGQMPADEPAPAKKDVSADAALFKPRPRMLIVDDNEVNRAYLAGLFKDEYLVDTAAEGTAALVRLHRYGTGISVVLLDLMMPGLDGFAVLKKMRESTVMQNIPVVVVSGMDERERALEAIRAGAADYITKPVDGALLRLRVASVLARMENERLRAQNRYLAMQNEENRRLAEARAYSQELSAALHAAEKADLAKSQFLSRMSHEIRTPLNAVIGYNSIARDALDGARTDGDRRQAGMKVLDCLLKSETASRQLLTIVNDVLDMSAIEQGKMKVDESPFDFRSLITSLSVMFFAQAKAKGVNFEVRFDRPTEEWFAGDQLRIHQVLTNLLSNAVKFTPEGGSVTLTITECHTDDGAAAFRFDIADTGIGMTQEYLTHLWTPFEQAESSISRRFGGSGLGLSITKSLVELMGGTIDVESKSGVGTRFTVGLTFRRTEQPARTLGVDFSGVNALVVDDDASTCDYIGLLFDRCGARCATFTSAREAVTAFAEAKRKGAPFNFCLIDWRMPGMDGFTTISELRRIADRELPIVVVTAYDFNEIAEYTQSLGISRFLSKPLFQSTLYDLLATVCGRKAVPQVREPAYDFKGARVLLVEDNSMNMEVAQHLLTSAGLAVDCAWNGREAVEIFSASKPGTYRVVLMDVHMPEIDGYQATRMIRASGRPDAASVPVIAMTADAFAEDIEQARGAGMNDHLAKPIDVETLYERLATYLGEQKK